MTEVLLLDKDSPFFVPSAFSIVLPLGGGWGWEGFKFLFLFLVIRIIDLEVSSWKGDIFSWDP